MKWIKKYKFLVKKQNNRNLYTVIPILTPDQLEELGIPYNKNKGGVKVKATKTKQPTLRDVMNILNIVVKDIKEIKADIVVIKTDIKAMKNTPTMKRELAEMGYE